MAVVIAHAERETLRTRWLDDQRTTDRIPDNPLPPAAEPWYIHELLIEAASGTKPCTTCCTQCCQNCCYATK